MSWGELLRVGAVIAREPQLVILLSIRIQVMPMAAEQPIKRNDLFRNNSCHAFTKFRILALNVCQCDAMIVLEPLYVMFVSVQTQEVKHKCECKNASRHALCSDGVNLSLGVLWGVLWCVCV